MTAREQLAEVIRDGEGVWRTPLEAADAILPLIREARAAELKAAAEALENDDYVLVPDILRARADAIRAGEA